MTVVPPVNLYCTLAISVAGLSIVSAPAAAQPPTLAALDAACASGDADACFARSARSSLSEAPALRARGCSLGHAEACAVALVLPRPVNAARFARIVALCRRGNLHACGWEGALRFQGEGTREDGARAAPLLERACAADIAIGCLMLGVISTNPVGGVTPDPARAQRSFLRVLALQQPRCTEGDSTACVDVSLLYLQGWGVPRNETQFWAHIRLACSLDHAEACAAIGRGYAQGTQGLELDPTRALPFLLRACQLGDEQSRVDGPELVFRHLVATPASAWTDRAALDALLTCAQASSQQRYPLDAEIHASIGAIHLRSGRAAEARDAFQAGLNALDRAPPTVGGTDENLYAPYVLGLALSLDALGQRGPARSAYERFIVLSAESLVPGSFLMRLATVDAEPSLRHARARIDALGPRR